MWALHEFHNNPNFTKSNFKDDLKNHLKDGLAFSKNLETLPLNKEEVGNYHQNLITYDREK